MREHLKTLTIKDIASQAKVSTATVDRVINGREGVRAATKEKVMKAIRTLHAGGTASTNRVHLTRIAFILEAGPTFIGLIEQAVAEFVNTQDHGIEYLVDRIQTGTGSGEKMATLIRERALTADGIVLMCADDPLVNRAVNQVVDSGIPVVCLTSDLPKSNRTAYVGSDQTSNGSTAGYLLGRMLPKIPGRILFVASAPYDCQVKREVGFRQVLRRAFPHLKIEERINSQDDSAYSYESTRRFLKDDRRLDAVYNAAGGNRGIAKALAEFGLTGKVVFIGHEVSDHTRELLDTEQMDIVISHDVYREVSAAVDLVKRYHNQEPVSDTLFATTFYTPYTSV